MFNVGWSKKNKEYYLWEEEEIFCNVCRNKAEKNFILNTTFNPIYKEIEQNSYCLTCFELVKSKLDGTQTLILIEKKPKDLIPVIADTLLPKIGSNVSNFGGKVLTDEDLKKEDPSKLDISRANVSFNPNRNKMVDFEKNKRVAHKRIKQLDSPFETEQEGLDYLDSIRDAKPILPKPKTKILLGKKE